MPGSPGDPGSTTTTAAPAARAASAFRRPTAPPPTTTRRRPVRSRNTGNIRPPASPLVAPAAAGRLGHAGRLRVLPLVHLPLLVQRVAVDPQPVGRLHLRP